MKKRIILIIFALLIFLSACGKKPEEYSLEGELEKHNIESLLLTNIYIENDESINAIAVTKESKEVFVKYEKTKENHIKIVEVLDSSLSFSYQDLVTKVNELEKIEFKNAINAIIRNPERIVITNEVQIKDVLKVNNPKFNALCFYFDIEGEINKFVFTKDLGDFYIANETMKEIHYPIYCEYDEFP